ncbi:MAG: efflux RND transporter periplasmic adaptor subunit [Hyphomicrobiaceae bacterium]|nr:efflux RND transporter periplasmic adaptor subunit [Hyphomicrobiaceae bacterium]
MKRSTGGWFVTLAVVGTAALAGAGWYYFFREPTATFDIQTVELSRGSIERSISATGSVEALVTVDVSSQLSGQISAVSVDFNSPVQKGGNLAVIDPRTFAARVASAEANLAIARTTVAVGEASVVKSKALRDQAQRSVERQRALIARNVTSAATLDTAETELATAKADLAVAEAQLENARATVKQREADLSQAKLDLDRTQIRAPIDGVVIARNIDLGSTVAASLQAPVLFQIAQDLKQIQILVLVDEADIGSIETGQNVTFTVDAFPDRVFRGEVAQVRIAGTTTNNVVTYTVVVRAQNPQQKLLPGMTATVRIVTGTRRDVLRVPNEAVRFTPPTDLTPAESPGRPNRDEAIVASISEKLKLSDEQIKQFSEGLAAARVSREASRTLRERRPANGETSTSVSPRRGAVRQSASGGTPERRGRLTRVLEGILTPEQFTEFKALRDEWRDTTRPAIVWTQSGKALQPHRMVLGLSDETFSEVVRAELKENDRVVTRARRNGGAERDSGRRGRR